jgi:hypothetical protein
MSTAINNSVPRKGRQKANQRERESADHPMPSDDNSPGEAMLPMRESAGVDMPTGGSLHTIAKAMLAHAEGDPKQAAIAMQDYLAEPDVRRRLTEDAMKIAVADSIASIRLYERGAIEHQARQQAEGIARRANSIDRAFMSFPLPFGGILADATKADIIKAVDHYEVSAATQQRRAAWLRRIADKLPENVIVSAALTEADLVSAWSGS